MYISTWILIVVVVAAFYFIEKRFKRIENYINIQENSPKNIEDLKPISYQIGISVEPEWIKVIRWCFPKLKSDEEAWEFVENLQKDSELKLDQEAGLFQKYFHFVEFYDGFSGLNPIWSTHYKEFTFTDDIEVRGHVFENGEKYKKNIWDKFPDNRIRRTMVISPSFIGFRSDLPNGAMGDEDKISQFPYYSVINFFADVQKDSGWDGDLMVKKFPEKIQQVFDKFGIKYDPWDFEDYGTGGNPNKELVESKWLEEKGIELYDQEMRSHTFKNPYFTVDIRLKFFSPK